jgi:hypothetical protein
VLTAAEKEDSTTRELALTAFLIVLNALTTKNALFAIKDSSYKTDNVLKDVPLDTSKVLYNAANARTPDVLDATLKLNKNALFATEDTYSRTQSALPNAVLDSTVSQSLLTRTTVDLAIRTALYAMAHIAAKSAIKDSS